MINEIKFYLIFHFRFARDLFGAKRPCIRDEGPKKNLEKINNKRGVSLMDENKKFGSMPTRSHGMSTVFHAGVIGEGKTEVKHKSKLTPDETDYNRFVFLSILSKIFQSGSKEKGKEASKQMALLMVEMVSPDVMYNGLPWPDEEFIKVTIERDLKIANSFNDHPLLWKIMMILAEARPALCYCSVLLRALLAVQMNFWQGSVITRTADSPKHLEVRV